MGKQLQDSTSSAGQQSKLSDKGGIYDMALQGSIGVEQINQLQQGVEQNDLIGESEKHKNQKMLQESDPSNKFYQSNSYNRILKVSDGSNDLMCSKVEDMAQSFKQLSIYHACNIKNNHDSQIYPQECSCYNNKQQLCIYGICDNQCVMLKQTLMQQNQKNNQQKNNPLVEKVPTPKKQNSHRQSIMKQKQISKQPKIKPHVQPKLQLTYCQCRSSQTKCLKSHYCLCFRNKRQCTSQCQCIVWDCENGNHQKKARKKQLIQEQIKNKIKLQCQHLKQSNDSKNGQSGSLQFEQVDLLCNVKTDNTPDQTILKVKDKSKDSRDNSDHSQRNSEYQDSRSQSQRDTEEIKY